LRNRLTGSIKPAALEFIVVDNKVPGYPLEALASWQGGVLIGRREGY